jgi:prefoldin alpha subunit
MANNEAEKKLQENMLAYRMLESRLGNIARQRDMIVSKIMEIQSTLITVEEIEKGSEDVLFPVGSAAYIRGKPADKEKIIVEIGAGVVMEKTLVETKKLLKDRKKELELAIDSLGKEMQNMASSMQKIEADAQEMVIKAQKKQKFGVVSSE